MGRNTVMGFLPGAVLSCSQCFFSFELYECGGHRQGHVSVISKLPHQFSCRFLHLKTISLLFSGVSISGSPSPLESAGREQSRGNVSPEQQGHG